MPKYETKQRKKLIGVLSLHADEMLSAEQIYALVEDNSISVSAIYRNLTELENEGKLIRLSRAGDRSVYYRYTDFSRCREKIHLSCSVCGKTFHMNTPQTEKLVDAVERSERFYIDRSKTVLFGVCEECALFGERPEAEK